MQPGINPGGSRIELIAFDGAGGSVGTPGSLSRISGRLRNFNSTCLQGQMIVQDLEVKLGRLVRRFNPLEGMCNMRGL